MTDLVARLRLLDSCAVSDACDRLGLDGRVTLVARPLTGATCIAGRIITVELGPASGGTSTRHLCAAAADAADPESVIVIAHQGRTDSAGWGGNLSRAARKRGAAGTIIHGAARDIDESIAIGYPVFASSATPRTARGRTREVTWAASIEFDGITVDHGDFVIADSTGVVFVPSGRIDEVIEAAGAIAAKEAAMAERIDAGQPVADVMGADYEACSTATEQESATHPPQVARVRLASERRSPSGSHHVERELAVPGVRRHEQPGLKRPPTANRV